MSEYTISRTEHWSDTEPPHPRAYKADRVYVDERTVDDPAKLRCKHDWYERGKNHRVEDGHIKRDLTHAVWCISVIDLMQFAEEVGEQLILTPGKSPHLPDIEIYDGYRE